MRKSYQDIETASHFCYNESGKEVKMSKKSQYLWFGTILILVLFLTWDTSNGLGSSEIFAGLAILLVLGAFLYLKNMQNVSEIDITQRIKAEYPIGSQPQIFEAYRRLKTRELEGLFSKILDDAKGDPEKVNKMVSVAEGVGWKAFIENKW